MLIMKMVCWAVGLNILFLLILRPKSLFYYIFLEASIVWIIYLLKDFIRRLNVNGFGDPAQIMIDANIDRQRSQFYGRKSEYKRLGRFFEDPEGGSLLIAGYRGSGKTRLVEESLRREPARLDRAPNFLFIPLLLLISSAAAIWQVFRKRADNKTIVRGASKKRVKYQLLQIKIPLIIVGNDNIGDGSRNKSEEYRSIILRAVAFALIKKVKYKEISRCFLLKRFWAITRLKIGVKSLKKFVDYTHLSHFENVEVGSRNKLAILGATRALSGQLDLSDAKLEMELLAVFGHLPNTGLKLVIVLDELDKLSSDSDDKSAKELEAMMMCLKNLFSTPFVYAIIVAGYSQGQYFANAVANRRDDVSLTLFKDVIILDALAPDRFEELVESRIVGIGGIDGENEALMLAKVTQGLGLYTSYSPGVLNSFLKRCDPLIEDIDVLLSKDLGARYTDDLMLIRGYVNDIYGYVVYGKHKIHNDDGHFNAAMHRIMCQASEVLLLDKDVHFSLDIPEIVLYDDSAYLRNNPGTQISELSRRYGNPGYDPTDKKPREAILFELYSGVLRDALRRSIIWLVVFLERSGIIQLERLDSGRHIVVVKSVNESVVSPGLDPYAIITERTPKEEALIEHIQNIRLIFNKFLGRVDDSIIEGFRNRGVPFLLIESEFHVGLDGSNATLMDWRNIDLAVESAEEVLIRDVLVSLEISNYHSYESKKSLGELSLDVDINVVGKKIGISFVFSDGWHPQAQDYYKVVVVRLPGVKLRGLAGMKCKQFDIIDGFEVVKKYLASLIIKLENSTPR